MSVLTREDRRCIELFNYFKKVQERQLRTKKICDEIEGRCGKNIWAKAVLGDDYVESKTDSK